jgi:uncharacterized membrane protein
MYHTRDSQFAGFVVERLYDIWDTLSHKLLVRMAGFSVNGGDVVVVLAVYVVVVVLKLLAEWC